MTNVGTDRHQLSNMAEQARTEMGVETLDAVADRGYFSSVEILACETAGVTVTLPKPMIERKGGRALRQAGLPLRRCGGCLHLSCRPKAGLLLHDRGQRLGATSLPNQRLSELRDQAQLHHRQRTTDLAMGARGRARDCAGTSRSPSGKNDNASSDGGTSVWHHQVLDGATHFLTKRLPKVATEMALNVLAYNMKRVMAIIGVAGLLQALAV